MKGENVKKLISINDFKLRIKSAWCKDTAYHSNAKDWTVNNPAIGQCTVTALLFQEIFGGKIFAGRVFSGQKCFGWHYWNELDGIAYDLTSSQFESLEPWKVVDVKEKKRNDVLRAGNVKERFSLLKSRFVGAYEYESLC